MKLFTVGKGALSFGLGLLAGVILPQCWIAVIAAVLLVVVAFVASRSGRQCC